MQISLFAYLNVILTNNAVALIWYQIWCSTMTKKWDMTYLPHTLPNEMSAISFLAAILKMAEFEVARNRF